jgi:UDP-N-acetylglucosamine 2-epimerase (non-hydrolysing)
MKIINIVGARPNLPKIAPLMREMQRHPQIDAFIIHTGQHYDSNLSDIFFRQMGIPEPRINLEVGSGSHAAQTGEILKRIEPLFVEHQPDLVVVLGDVNSTIAAGLAAAKLRIPLAHVEAGLRSFDRSMPEEINRVLTDTIADYLFVTEEDAIQNLLKEGHLRESIYFVGNVMIDSLRHFLSIAQKSSIGEEMALINGEGWKRFGVLTLHRPSNVDSDDKLAELISAVDAVASEVPIVFPVHPRTHQRLKQARIKYHPQLRIVPPLGYLDFLCLLSKATLVLTDSGGIQEETSALGVPCLTLRKNTERPVTISSGTNTLVGTCPSEIVAAARAILAGKGKSGCIPPLWDGRAAERIVEILLQTLPSKKGVSCS